MGFVFAAVFLWLARPTWATMAASLLLVVPGLWLRGYASGYVKKNAELATTGPYAHTRNPLYLGSMLIAFGFAAAAWNLDDSAGVGGAVCGDLYSDDSGRRSVSARAFRGLRGLRARGAEAAAAADSGASL